MTTMVAVNRMHFPVTVLGPGRRAGVWFQGCSVHCDGCMSLDTWTTHGAQAVSVDRVLEWIDGLPGDVDGVTITGGEPTDQPAALQALLSGLDAWRANTERDVLVFTGRSPDWARGEGAAVLAGTDAVVAGPFVPTLAGTTALRGSENQELITFTDLGRRAYADLSRFPRSALQLEADGDGLWLVGIPMPGGLDAFDEVRAGLGSAERRTWR